MIEQFESRRLTGPLNIKLRNDDGSSDIWCTRKEKVIEDIVSIVERYEQLGYKLTLRQLHYQMVVRNAIINHQTAYKRLGEILDDCRYAGMVDWDSIEDRGRIPKIPYQVSGPRDAIEDALKTYRLDRQDGQQNVVEVWTEKDALSAILWDVTAEYHVRLCVNKGYTSSSAMYSAYSRFSDAINEGKTVTVLYLGDHDPSGLDMVRDIRERLTFMLERGDQLHERFEDESLNVIQMGLNMEQIKRYKLPPNPAKITDSRAAAYIEKFGRESWEVDALEPTVLTALLHTHIKKEIDMPSFIGMKLREREDKETLQTIIDGLPDQNQE